MNPVRFGEHETHLPDGRRIVIWTLAPSARAHTIPVVVGAAFARRMHHTSAIAMYGAHNGFFVTRYDPVNHVGLSDGEMLNFTLTDSLESLRAAVDWTCEATGQPKVAIVATSLTARVAFELAAQSDRVALVVTAVGVVNMRKTLACVFGEDWSGQDPETADDNAVFEGKAIAKRVFGRDALANDWWSLERCIRVLRAVKQPLVSFVGTEDEWVDPADVQRAFSEGVNGPRKLLTLERAPHDLGRNHAIAHTFLRRTFEEVLAGTANDPAVQDPDFELLMEQALIERRIQRAAGADASR